MIYLVRYMEWHPSLQVQAIVAAPNPFGGEVEQAVNLDAADLPGSAWNEYDVAAACAVKLGLPVEVAVPPEPEPEPEPQPEPEPAPEP